MPDSPEKKLMDFVAEDRNWTDRIMGEWRGARLWGTNWGFLSTGYERLDARLRAAGGAAARRPADGAGVDDVFTLALPMSQPRSVDLPANVYFWESGAADEVKFIQDDTVIR